MEVRPKNISTYCFEGIYGHLKSHPVDEINTDLTMPFVPEYGEVFCVYVQLVMRGMQNK